MSRSHVQHAITCHGLQRRILAAALASGLLATCAVAANQPAKPAAGATPIAQYWMDIATFNMMGMDEMPEMAGMGGMMGGMMGRTGMTGRDGRHAKGVGNFGETRGASATAEPPPEKAPR